MHGMGCVKFPEEVYSHNANSDNLRCHKTVYFFILLQVSELQLFQYRIHTKCKQRFNSYFVWVSELKIIFHVTLYYRGIAFLDQNFFLIISQFVISF